MHNYILRSIHDRTSITKHDEMKCSVQAEYQQGLEHVYYLTTPALPTDNRSNCNHRCSPMYFIFSEIKNYFFILLNSGCTEQLTVSKVVHAFGCYQLLYSFAL